MVRTFLDHGWKKWTRSVSFTKEMATTIFLGVVTLMIAAYLLAFGFFLPTLLKDALNQADPIGFLHRLLIYYFLFDFVFRYLLQSVPVVEIRPYLHLPIKRSGIIHFLLGRSLFHPLNVFVLLLLGPMAFMTVAPEQGMVVALCWIGGFWLIAFAIHFLVMLFKVKLDDTLWGIILLVTVFSGLGLADYYGWFKLSDVSKLIFDNALAGPSFLAGCFALVALIYGIAFLIFRNSIYADEVPGQDKKQYGYGDFTFLRSLGSMGEWINLELKLILRNKRPRTLLFLSAFFLLYGMIFYPNPMYTEEMPGFLLFVGIFVTGVFMINYGQYLYSWQSSHFDFTLTKPVSLREVVNSKYWLLGAVSVICFLLTIPYVFFGWHIVLTNAAMLFFNLGVNAFIIMNLAMWSPKKIDMTKGGAFNIQGVGAAQWVMGLPIFLGPYVFYLPLSLMGYPLAGTLLVGFVGLLGIMFRPWLLNMTARRLQQRKHVIAEGFRKD
jgi:hypothetical protein